jgi:superoxide dismutase, Fe-Mn family
MNRISRRHFLATASATAATVAGHASAQAPAAAPAAPAGPFTLAPLPYAPEALEPHIDAVTMGIHHGKHHKAYVDNLNKALAPYTELQKKPLEAIIGDLNFLPEDIRKPVQNNGGGHWNHAFFWSLMAAPGKPGVGAPAAGGSIGQDIAAKFESLEKFQALFAEAAMKRFGSGWAWLIVKADKSLAVVSTGNQDNPLMQGIVPNGERGVPILGLDVWEHAYYLKYQNKRADYVSAWWNVVNWNAVQKNYEAALEGIK